ncbi:MULTISPECIES: Wadjet anti-phage system protein JetD domain-containing protein [unclassified Nocardioides]|uniref:Wadjet anti-phage system protein JetD domain-containing protein n=1 Tax=unclassified Nocardioides TaxID=2615069 RepID=UPI0006F2D5A1|nr:MULTISPECIES: DUF3322 and DUF2220 domain-containing protein [unclassified Nocardioides]KRA30031.1 hypothetical protein ASD81_20290 [Nocardioides sp. Root614]KRA86951.1 hypothetical protein ASD84_22505 [Nocardioides sp. Root682]
MRSDWATPATVTDAVRRKWDSGQLLAALHAAPHDQTRLFPLRVRLPRPDRDELSNDFKAATAWARRLQDAAIANGWTLDTRRTNVPGLGMQPVPYAAIVPSGEVALALLSSAERKQAQVFASAIAVTECHPVIADAARAVALQRPHDVVAAGDAWALLLSAALWVADNPRPGVYVREIPVAGMHTKVVETNRALFGRLLETTTNPASVPVGAKTMEEKYGFRVPQRRVRIRGPRHVLGMQAGPGDADVTWPIPDLGAFIPSSDVTEVVVVENQTSFLVVPDAPNRLVIWGAGYGADELVASLPWLAHVRLHYWGDIDTHGFAILDAVRCAVEHTESVLMDVETLTAHRDFYVTEARQSTRELNNLTPNERRVLDGLRIGAWGPRVRLEQEFIRFDRVRAAFQQP